MFDHITGKMLESKVEQCVNIEFLAKLNKTTAKSKSKKFFMSMDTYHELAFLNGTRKEEK